MRALLIALFALLSTAAMAGEPFGTIALETSASRVNKWAAAANGACQGAPAACRAARSTFDGIIAAARRSRNPVAAVNSAVNRAVAYQGDVGDEWQSPLTTLARGFGDCEDYAIAKYFALLRVGIPASHMRLVVYKGHAVLTILVGEDWLVLDNRFDQIGRRVSWPGSPVYSIGEGRLRLYAVRG